MKRSRVTNTVYTVAAVVVLGGGIFSQAAGPREFIGSLWGRRPRMKEVGESRLNPRNWMRRNDDGPNDRPSRSTFAKKSTRKDLYRDPFAGTILPDTNVPVSDNADEGSSNAERPINAAPTTASSVHDSSQPDESGSGRAERSQLLPSHFGRPDKEPAGVQELPPPKSNQDQAERLPAKAASSGTTHLNRFTRGFDREFQKIVDGVIQESRERPDRGKLESKAAGQSSNSVGNETPRGTDAERNPFIDASPDSDNTVLPLRPGAGRPQKSLRAELIVPKDRPDSFPEIQPGIRRSEIRAPQPGTVESPATSPATPTGVRFPDDVVTTGSDSSRQSSLIEAVSPGQQPSRQHQLPLATANARQADPAAESTRQAAADIYPALPRTDRRAAAAKAREDFSRFIPSSRKLESPPLKTASQQQPVAASQSGRNGSPRPRIVEFRGNGRQLEELLEDQSRSSSRYPHGLAGNRTFEDRSLESHRMSFSRGTDLYELRQPSSQDGHRPSPQPQRAVPFADREFRARWGDQTNDSAHDTRSTRPPSPIKPRVTSNGARTISVPNPGRLRQLSYEEEQPELSGIQSRIPARFPDRPERGQDSPTDRRNGASTTNGAPKSSLPLGSAPSINWPGNPEMVAPTQGSGVPWGFSGSLLAIIIAVVALLMHRSCKVVTVVTTDSREAREQLTEAAPETPVN